MNKKENNISMFIRTLVSVVLAIFSSIVLLFVSFNVYERVTCSWEYCEGYLCELGPPCPVFNYVVEITLLVVFFIVSFIFFSKLMVQAISYVKKIRRGA